MKQILIIDDQPDIRKLLEMVLTLKSVKVLTADNGKQGVEIARTHRPDLVFVDLMMPGGIDGYEVIRRLRADPRCTELPIILMTASHSQSERLKALEKGADAFLQKPFRIGEIFSHLDQALAPQAAS